MSEPIKSLQNPLVKYLLKLRTNHDFRRHEGYVVLEGGKIIEEVCCSVMPRRVLVSDVSIAPKVLQNFPVQLVSKEIIKKIAGSVNPEGIIAEFPIPKGKSQIPATAKKILLLDRISDPEIWALCSEQRWHSVGI